MAGVGQGAGYLETRLKEAIRAALTLGNLGYIRYSDAFPGWFALLFEFNLITFFILQGHNSSSCWKTYG